jgi:hypothetical protein
MDVRFKSEEGKNADAGEMGRKWRQLRKNFLPKGGGLTSQDCMEKRSVRKKEGEPTGGRQGRERLLALIIFLWEM